VPGRPCARRAEINRHVARAKTQHAALVEGLIKNRVAGRTEILRDREPAAIRDFHRFVADVNGLNIDISAVRFPFSLGTRLGQVNLRQRKRAAGKLGAFRLAHGQAEKPLIRATAHPSRLLDKAKRRREMIGARQLRAQGGEGAKESHAPKFTRPAPTMQEPKPRIAARARTLFLFRR